MCGKFPHLYILCLSRNVSIFSSIAFLSLSINWNGKFNFKRNLNDREAEELATLMLSIENSSIDELKETKGYAS